ncbi:isochorismatase family protein [Virgibacillus sp. LDC-1]|uniref:isochorismatase family protein n=1 Tax=Virgibacillus sp. LDC-1 TaxID=3039856 RepID=UPI0024DE1B8D|nr:isochorismatase family protein [Virgibacillus sp. LDC-1]
MKALLVIDVQNGIVNHNDFREELDRIETIITDFKRDSSQIICMRHLVDDDRSPLYKESEGSELLPFIQEAADHIVIKKTPSSFFKTGLEELLIQFQVKHLFIVGFNTEFCCMFTAIAAYDRGFDVTFVEDATGTVNDGNTYEMSGLDIRDFVGTVLHWSDAIEVLDFEEYVEKYRN